MKIRRGRLRRLIRFLRALPPRRFDFDSWVGDNWKGKPDLSCGTTACGLGWACTIPEFQKLGASLSPKRAKGSYGEPAWKGVSGPRQVSEKLFGLTDEQHQYLFIPGTLIGGYSGLTEDTTAQDLAAHIEMFLRTHRPKKRPTPVRRKR